MQIVSLWWQYAGRVWSHANSAQPPNSYLAPKLKINTAHWNNSLHIGGTWYCPSHPYTSSASSGQKSPDTTRHALDQGPHPSWANCSPRLVDSIVKFSYGGSGVIHVSDPDWHLIPNMLNWVHVWTPSWPVHDLNILLVQKGCRVTCCMGRGIVLDVHKVTSKQARRHGNIWFLRIWMYGCRFMAPSTTTSSLLPPWWIAPHTVTDEPRFPSLGWTQASISLSSCLRRTRTRPSLWYRENRDSSLKIWCLHFWGPILCASSPTHGGVACAPKRA